MSIPNIAPFFGMYYTKQDGSLTTDGSLYNDQLFQILNQVVILLNSVVNSVIINNQISNNGITPPPFTTAQIIAFSTDTTIPNGTLWFNTDISKWQGKTAPGVIQTITST